MSKSTNPIDTHASPLASSTCPGVRVCPRAPRAGSGDLLGTTGYIKKPCVRRGGFTLIEALLAMLLVAVVLPAIMGAVRMSTRMAALTEDRRIARVLADAKMHDLLISQDFTNGVLSGTFREQDLDDESAIIPSVFDSDPRAWRWRLDLEVWQDITVNQLTLVIEWDRWGRTRQYRIDTLVQENAAAGDGA